MSNVRAIDIHLLSALADAASPFGVEYTTRS